jgi:branched-chain amino acid transport system ATP-binding protein
MLRISNIEVVYLNAILVLRGVSLEVGTGRMVALLGANGAGKTTTLKAVSGLLKTEEGEVTHGTIELEGQRIDRLGPQEIAMMGAIQVMEGRRLYKHLSTEENLRAGGILSGNRAIISRNLTRVYEYFPRLKDLRKKTSGYLSGGEQQMLVIGRALMSSPKIMLLDEPSMGLAPLLVKEIFSIVRRINSEEHTSVLLVEQNAKAALEIAEYGYVMENGRVVLDGSSEKLKENEDIKEFYLGLSQLGEKKSYKKVKHYKRRKRWIG